MADTILSRVRVSAVEETDRHDRQSLFQKPVWTSESGATQNLRKGDHIWCHARGYLKAIQHHGIFDGTGVYHFDCVEVDENDQYKVDHYYIHNGCPTCSSRLNQRKEAGLPSTGVRFNCLSCFSHGRKVYRCEYESSIAELVWRETGSRSTQVCNRSGEEVVRLAKWVFENDNFGKYELLTRNCEDFARWCKIGKLGSKQVSRAEVLMWEVTCMAFNELRIEHESELEKLKKMDKKLLLSRQNGSRLLTYSTATSSDLV